MVPFKLPFREKECSQCRNWNFKTTTSVWNNSDILIDRGKCLLDGNIYSHWFFCKNFNKGRRDNNDLREEDEE